jgi:hypothetical protein
MENLPGDEPSVYELLKTRKYTPIYTITHTKTDKLTHTTSAIPPTCVMSQAFMNCANTLPNRPLAANNPMADVRTAVGNASVDRQSNAFQPLTATALKAAAMATVVSFDSALKRMRIVNVNGCAT